MGDGEGADRLGGVREGALKAIGLTKEGLLEPDEPDTQ